MAKLTSLTLFATGLMGLSTIATAQVTASTTPTTTTIGTIASATVTEPTLAAVPFPKVNAVNLVGTDITARPLANVPTPTIRVSQVATIPTIIVPATTTKDSMIDMSVVDDFISFIAPKARHYPPVFVSRTERYNATQRLKQLTAWIDSYAKNPNASYDVLLRAAKLNAYGRNLDLGSEYAVRAGDYIARAIRQNDTAEANFIYGVMLAEGGGFKEGAKYLEKAERMGYAEATQSLAQADILSDNRQKALSRLTEFKAKYPNDPYIDAQLAIINSGKYYLWDLPAVTAP